VVTSRKGGGYVSPTRSSRQTDILQTEIFLVVTPDPDAPNLNCRYYRVIAVDKYGARSAPSEFITLPEGFLVSSRKIKYIKGKPFNYQPRILCSLGKISTKMPYFIGLWKKPEYHFEAQNLPAGIRLNEKTGRITGTPRLSPGQRSFSFTLRVLSGRKSLSKNKIEVEME